MHFLSTIEKSLPYSLPVFNFRLIFQEDIYSIQELRKQNSGVRSQNIFVPPGHEDHPELNQVHSFNRAGEEKNKVQDS